MRLKSVKSCLSPAQSMRTWYHSLHGSESWHHHSLSERLHPLHSTKHVHREISQLAPYTIHLTSRPLWLTPAPSLLLPRQGFWATVELSSLSHDSFPWLFFFLPLLPPSASRHQPIPPQWSRGMQGCIPGLMKLLLQESKPEWSLDQHHKKQKAVCLSGEPHKITEAF